MFAFVCLVVLVWFAVFDVFVFCFLFLYFVFVLLGIFLLVCNCCDIGGCRSCFFFVFVVARLPAFVFVFVLMCFCGRYLTFVFLFFYILIIGLYLFKRDFYLSLTILICDNIITIQFMTLELAYIAQ